MRETITNFYTQFKFEPVIENADKLEHKDKVIIAGMGGSHLAGDILKCWDPYLPITIHSDYGLPSLAHETLRDHLIIASSYSGNTEETLDALEQAVSLDLSIIVLTSGGKLLERAQTLGLPYVQLPPINIQPRMATGYSLRAILKVMNNQKGLDETSFLAQTLKPVTYEHTAKALAETLHGKVPIIYASARNQAIASNWKIKLNETGKIPAFWNVLPELNHNEMTGFDITEATASLSKNSHVILLKDNNDHHRVMKRMTVIEQLYREKGLEVSTVELEHTTLDTNRFHTIFASTLTADWTAYHLALSYGLDPEQVPMVEAFKKLIQ